jgi:hypothetical protein
LLYRELIKRIRLLNRRSEIVRTRFELDQKRGLVEHVTLETHDSLPEEIQRDLGKGRHSRRDP